MMSTYESGQDRNAVSRRKSAEIDGKLGEHSSRKDENHNIENGASMRARATPWCGMQMKRNRSYDLNRQKDRNIVLKL